MNYDRPTYVLTFERKCPIFTLFRVISEHIAKGEPGEITQPRPDMDRVITDTVN